MHAYLLVGTTNNQQLTINNLAKRLGAKVLEYPISKIDDTRELNNLIRLSFREPTLIICQDIHEATEEALNAFLKNLEEPQENIYFALTAPSTRKVLPTIVSRCQIIKVESEKSEINIAEVNKFLRAGIGERLAQVDKIKAREDAIKFVENLASAEHSALHSGDGDYTALAKNLEEITKTLGNLKANGNVMLQLTNMVISLE
jgi:DNA polymerase III delta prime subunit